MKYCKMCGDLIDDSEDDICLKCQSAMLTPDDGMFEEFE